MRIANEAGYWLVNCLGMQSRISFWDPMVEHVSRRLDG